MDSQIENTPVETVVTQQKVIKLKLVSTKSKDGKNGEIIPTLVVVNEDVNGNCEDGNGLLPYIDGVTVSPSTMSPLKNGNSDSPRLRYYSVGPSTYDIRCPLCQQNGNASVIRGCGLKDATCCLSLLSCIYPIFWLCCLFTCCSCCNSRGWYAKGFYCSQCGGKLGNVRKQK